MHRRLFYICLTCVFLFSCKKENDNPQWDIEVLGPLLYASLGIEDIDADSSIIADGNGAQFVSYDSLLSLFDLDTLSQVKDTSIRTITLFPPFNTTLPPNFPFTSNNNNIGLGLSGVQLREAIIESGKIRLEIKNSLKTKVYFTYTIPKALKNNIPFTATAVVDSGSVTDPKFFSGEFDFTGYKLDLTGPAGTSFNTLSYNVRAVSDSLGFPGGFEVLGGDTILNLTTTLVSLKPYYAKGYLGQQENSDVSISETGLQRIIKSGLVHLDSIKMNLDLKNSIGADAQLFFNSLRSINNRTGMNVDLMAPSFIQRNININRAGETHNSNEPVAPSFYPIQLDHLNSNIVSFIENLPDRISYDYRLKINPLGNVSGSNDFIYSDRLLDARLRILMPLRFATNQLILADTVPFEIDNATNFDPVGATTLTLLADNGFPVDLNVQLFLLDSTGTVTDSLFVPDLIARAPVDINYRAQGKTATIIKIPVDADRKKRLQEVTRVGIRIGLNTPDYPQLIQMYNDYRLNLKLIADGIYMIR